MPLNKPATDGGWQYLEQANVQRLAKMTEELAEGERVGFVIGLEMAQAMMTASAGAIEETIKIFGGHTE